MDSCFKWTTSSSSEAHPGWLAGSMNSFCWFFRLGFRATHIHLRSQHSLNEINLWFLSFWRTRRCLNGDLSARDRDLSRYQPSRGRLIVSKPEQRPALLLYLTIFFLFLFYLLLSSSSIFLTFYLPTISLHFKDNKLRFDFYNCFSSITVSVAHRYLTAIILALLET